MNAQIAKEITAASKTNLLNDLDGLINQAKCRVYEYVEMSAKKGNSETKLNLKTVGFEVVNKNLDRVKVELEAEGYQVEYLLTRSPDGTREMTVRW